MTELHGSSFNTSSETKVLQSSKPVLKAIKNGRDDKEIRRDTSAKAWEANPEVDFGGACDGVLVLALTLPALHPEPLPSTLNCSTKLS